jgi:tetratricopeptide (TPR) repeat protein
MPQEYTRYAALKAEVESCLRAGRLNDAEGALGEIVRLNPREHVAWSLLAKAALQRGEASMALGQIDRALEGDRRNAGYLNLKAVAQAESGELDAAEATLRRALREQPAYAEAHYNLGKVLEKKGDLRGARRAYERAVALDPCYPGARGNYALVLQRLGELDLAQSVLEASVADDPSNAWDIVLLGKALMATRGLDAAIALYEDACRRLPQSAMLRRALAYGLLARGDFSRGWREHLGRDALGPTVRSVLPEPLPEQLAGRTVTLWGEQGLGDELFFLRYAIPLAERGAQVVAHVQRKLVPLLARSERLEKVVEQGSIPRAAISTDTFAHLGDLPFLLQCDVSVPPFPLRASPELETDWRQRLAALGAPPYIGVTWRAGTDLRRGPEFGRSIQVLAKEISLEALAGALRDAPGMLLCLQRQPAPGEIDALAAAIGRPLHDCCALNEDLESMTALLAVLDDYVAVSNTNVHLRAGVGKTSRVLVPFPPEWRWMATGDESPWFPGCRVYRQSPRREWGDAMQWLAADLRRATSGEAYHG